MEMVLRLFAWYPDLIPYKYQEYWSTDGAVQIEDLHGVLFSKYYLEVIYLAGGG